ncbi:sodium- and chloride-dependent glycine transporter 1-like [Ixodes scapularis]|uniref:sodium- and chloride-dependent glycine transporter 1-like n=1 Tax=Ixodes scapularis TaxID=6945 RepID=UPI001A9E3372|nr:sodium- and chloride-dependent glycine transporter 1-like [Ixodes scapularis]
MGLSVGIGNLWRFPYLVFENGGGAFLLVYMIVLLLVGKPLYYLEMFLGQFSSSGCLGVWAAFPMGKGVGVTMAFGSLCLAICYNMYLAYALIYMYYSVGSRLPWTGCYSTWGANTRICYIRKQGVKTCKAASQRLYQRFQSQNITFGVAVSTHDRNILVPHKEYALEMTGCVNATKSAAEHFFWDKVLESSQGFGDIKPMKLDLTICYFIVWIHIFLFTCKGIKWFGKVVLLTATCPYLIFFALLMKGVSLEGAGVGVSAVFVPVWQSIFTLKCWRVAIEQCVLSLCIATGCLSVLSSYNDFYNDIFQDAWCFAILNFIWGVLSSTAIFSTVGSMSVTLNTSLSEIVMDNMPSLAFVNYTEALSNLPFPQMWCMLFFVALFLFGLNTSVFLIHTVLSAIVEHFPGLKDFGTELTLLFCIGAFLCGLPLCTSAGPYFMQFLESYFGASFFVILALVEAVFFSWGYSTRRIIFDIEFMYSATSAVIYKALWGFLIPLMLLLACLSGILVKIPTTLLDYKLPLYSDIAGCLMLMFSLGLIPVWAITWLRRQNFNCDDALQPSYKWGPEEPPIFNAYQARLRNRGLVAMTSLFPVRYVAPKTIPPDSAVTVVFAAEPARAPTDQPVDNLEDVARFWALPPNLPGLDLSRMAVSLPRVGGDAGRRADVAPERALPGREPSAPPLESTPAAPLTRRSSLPGIPGYRYRPVQRPPRPLVSNFLPTVHPNTLGPQFSESPMRFGLLGRMFVRRHDESDEVLIPGIPVQPPGPCLNPLPPPVRYPVQPGGPFYPGPGEHQAPPPPYPNPGPVEHQVPPPPYPNPGPVEHQVPPAPYPRGPSLDPPGHPPEDSGPPYPLDPKPPYPLAPTFLPPLPPLPALPPPEVEAAEPPRPALRRRSAVVSDAVPEVIVNKGDDAGGSPKSILRK